MADAQILHPVLGRTMPGTDTCSKCGQTIPEDHVPLILWDQNNHDLMWVYCETCEGGMLQRVQIVSENGCGNG